VLARLRVGGLALQLQHGLLRLDVFLLDLHLFVAAQLVGAHVLHGSQLGDLLDALCVEDVAAVQLGQRCLLQVVDGGVFQHIA
jgi:hypothetical protein